MLPTILTDLGSQALGPQILDNLYKIHVHVDEK